QVLAREAMALSGSATIVGSTSSSAHPFGPMFWSKSHRFVLQLRNPENWTECAASAMQIGKPLVEPLIGALSSADGNTRVGAAYVLGHLHDTDAVPALVGALKDVEPNVRYAAADALSRTGGRAVEEALLAALGDPDADLREAVVGVLRQVAPEKLVFR